MKITGVKPPVYTKIQAESRVSEEKQLKELTRRIARTILPMNNVSIHNADNIANFSVQDFILKAKSELDFSNSQWAPWSINYKKKI